MRMKNVIRILSVLILLIAAGCSQMRTASRLPSVSGESLTLTPELEELYREVALRTGKVEALDGYADLYVTTPKRKAKAYCNVQLRKSQDARLIVTAGILGWPVADLWIRPDSLFVNDMLNNRMLVGRNSGENLGKIIGISSGFGSITETLFGIADMTEPVSAIESVRQTGGLVSYRVRSEGGAKEFFVDALSKKLVGVTYFDFYGRRTAEFRFDDYQVQQHGSTELMVPREIDMTLFRGDDPAGSRSLKVVYDERIINPDGFTIRFRKPSRVRTVNLDEVEQLPWL
ncbi:MAG: DUF4292 domain-containing protein [Chlorobiaceae bacterium]|nr:DUF4292 domain-containing protein [Chlorobiaceae bacterium]